MVPENNLERLLSFILEREKIRARKDSGVPWPWTEDPVLLRYKIANIRREDDKVTRWLARTWRQPHDSDPLLWFSMSVARFINWPPTLEELGYPIPWAPGKVLAKLEQRASRKRKVLTDAYLVMGGVRGSKYTYIVNSVLQGLWEMRRTFPASKGSSLRTAYVWLMQQHGLGTFMAQEIVADLKYQSAWRNASDWWTFAAPGRGSFQGTAYLMNRPQKRSLESSRRGVETRINTRMNEEEWRSILAYVQKWINARLVRRRLEPLHAQDVQGALCEFARYERILRGEGFTRRYTPAHSQTEVS